MKLMKTCILLVFAGAMSLVGCSDKPKTNHYKIGAVLPLTGPIGYLGEQELVGLKLARDDINGRAKPNGFSVQLSFEDSGSQVANAVTAARKLIDIDKVDALFVSTTSATRAIAPLAQAANIPLLAMSSDPGITNASTVIFRVFMNSNVEQGLLAKRIVGLGIKNVFVLHNQDRAFEAAYRELKSLLAANDIKNVDAETFEKTQTDFRTIIQKAKQAKADAYVFIGFGSEFPLLLSQWGEKGNAHYFGNYTFGTAGAQSQGKTLIEGIEFPTFSVRNDSPQLASFKKRALDMRGGKPLSDFMDHLYSYESMLFIEQCALTKFTGHAQNLLEGCNKIKILNALSGEITIDQHRNANVPMSLGVYRNGSLKNTD